MDSYKDLIVWQKSMQLSKEVYRPTESFPKTEIYGISNQLRRASVSIPSNIAEGFSRKSLKENLQFISIAFGSTSELETQLLLAKDLSFAHKSNFEKAEQLLLEVRKMLSSVFSKLKSKS